MIDLQEALLRSDEPRRPLDWRFRRAVSLSQSAPRSRRARPTDDTIVSAYADLLHRLKDYETYTDLERVRRRHPDLFRVHLAYVTLNATELALADAFLLCRSVNPEMIHEQTGMDEKQQIIYRQMFLAVMDRRQMSSFIASQIMEPAKLRASALEGEEKGDLETPVKKNRAVVYGTFPDRALRVLRLVGFYSSPIVVELMYSGFLADAFPDGRDSATKYLTQAYLANVRRRGMFSAHLADYDESGIQRFMQLAYALALEEREEGQFDIMQNIAKWADGSGLKIAYSDKMIEATGLPSDTFTGVYEWSEAELVLAAKTGKLPDLSPITLEETTNV